MGSVLNVFSGIGFSDEGGGRGEVDLAGLPRNCLKLQERCWSLSDDASGGIGEPDLLGLLDERERRSLMAWRRPFFFPLSMLMEGNEQELCTAYIRPVSGKRRLLFRVPCWFSSLIATNYFLGPPIYKTCYFNLRRTWLYVLYIVAFLPRTCITLSEELRYAKVRLEMASLGNPAREE